MVTHASSDFSVKHALSVPSSSKKGALCHELGLHFSARVAALTEQVNFDPGCPFYLIHSVPKEPKCSIRGCRLVARCCHESSCFGLPTVIFEEFGSPLTSGVIKESACVGAHWPEHCGCCWRYLARHARAGADAATPKHSVPLMFVATLMVLVRVFAQITDCS